MCYFCVLFSKCVEDLFPLQIVYRGIYDWNWNHGIGKALSSLTVDSACFIYLLNLYLNFPFGCCFFPFFCYLTCLGSQPVSAKHTIGSAMLCSFWWAVPFQIGDMLQIFPYRNAFYTFKTKNQVRVVAAKFLSPVHLFK